MNNKSTYTAHLHIKLTPVMLEKLKKLAYKSEVTCSEYVRKIVNEKISGDLHFRRE